MRALGQGEAVAELVALLGAVDEGEWLATEESKPGNVHGDTIAASTARKRVQQTAARVLEEKFVDLVVPQGPGVVGRNAHVTIGLVRSAGKRILTEILRPLRIHLDACDRAGADAAAQRKLLALREPMVQAERIKAGALE